MSSAAYSDRVVLKNGKVVTGTVESQLGGTVKIKTNEGLKEISMSEVVSVIYVETKKSTNNSQPSKVVTENKTVETVKPEKSAQVVNNNSDRVYEKTEKVTVDKELTNKVMDTFQEADKRRAEQTKEQIQALKEEIEYFKKEKDRTKNINDQNDEFKKQIDKRMSNLEIRTRRLEKYLGMDETMVDYYQRKRSPWDLVWRSALFPGWGHRYAKEEYTGNTYSTTILILLGVGYLINYQAGVAERTLASSTQTKIVSTYLQYQSVGITPTFTNASLYRLYGNAETAQETIDSQKNLGSLLFNTALVLYVFQLGHAYFTGVEWAKSKPRDYSNEELMKPVGLNFKTGIDYGIANQRGTEYKLEYSTRF
jgi:hypothetical protein